MPPISITIPPRSLDLSHENDDRHHHSSPSRGHHQKKATTHAMHVNKHVRELNKNQRPRWGRLAQIIKFIFILNCIGIMQLYFSSRLLASLPPPAAAPDRITKPRDPAAPNAHSPLSHALLRGSNADKLRLDKIAQYYKVGKPTVMDAMKRMYDGKPLDPKYVRHILIEGKKILSGLDTIYDMPIPPIKEKHGVHSSQNNMGGGDEDGKSSVVTVSIRLLLILCCSTITSSFFL